MIRSGGYVGVERHIDSTARQMLEIMGQPRLLQGGLNTGRAAEDIRLATEKAGWGRKLPQGHGLGLAFHFSHAGHFAEVAEVSVDPGKRIRLRMA